MKIKILVVLIALVFAGTEVYSEGCSNLEVLIDLQLTAYNEVDSSKNDTSDYQMPRFREDDWLQLRKITVYNYGPCKIPTSYIKINFQTPYRTIESPFDLHTLVVPPLEPNSNYAIWLHNISEDQYGVTLHYIDNHNGSNDYFHRTQLFDVGNWNLKVKFEVEKEEERNFEHE